LWGKVKGRFEQPRSGGSLAMSMLLSSALSAAISAVISAPRAARRHSTEGASSSAMTRVSDCEPGFRRQVWIPIA